MVVDDGSTDSIISLVEKRQEEDPFLRLIEHEETLGKGAAVRTGILKAMGDEIIFTDADGSTPFKEYFNLRKELGWGYDIAIASRALKESEIDTVWYRKIPGRCFHFFVKNFLLPNFTDTQCGFKLFKRLPATYLAILQQSNEWSFDLELLFMAEKSGIAVKEVPVEWQIREGISRICFFTPLCALCSLCLYF